MHLWNLKKDRTKQRKQTDMLLINMRKNVRFKIKFYLRIMICYHSPLHHRSSEMYVTCVCIPVWMHKTTSLNLMREYSITNLNWFTLLNFPSTPLGLEDKTSKQSQKSMVLLQHNKEKKNLSKNTEHYKKANRPIYTQISLIRLPGISSRATKKKNKRGRRRNYEFSIKNDTGKCKTKKNLFQ